MTKRLDTIFIGMMRAFLILPLLLLGCPKQPIKTLDETDREEKLKELLEEEEFEDLPESGELPEG